MKGPELVSMLFLARDVAHSVHLKTKSYARHKTLDKFYHAVIEVADDFAEAWQGRNGLLGQIPRGKVANGADIVAFLEDQLRQIEEGRFEVAKRTDTPIQNIVDGICGLYLSTIYRLKTLS